MFRDARSLPIIGFHPRSVSCGYATIRLMSVRTISVECWIFPVRSGHPPVRFAVRGPSRPTPSPACGVLSGSGGEALPVQLPFTEEQFFDLFVVYNRGVLARPGRTVDRFCRRQHAPVLGAPSSGSLDQRCPDGALVLVGAGVPRRVLHRPQPCRMGVRRAFPHTRRGFPLVRSDKGPVVVCSWARCVGAGGVAPDHVLVAVPGINAVEHLSISRIPAFGVPCPTMIFTAGMLMLAAPQIPWGCRRFQSCGPP